MENILKEFGEKVKDIHIQMPSGYQPGEYIEFKNNKYMVITDDFYILIEKIGECYYAEGYILTRGKKGFTHLEVFAEGKTAKDLKTNLEKNIKEKVFFIDKE